MRIEIAVLVNDGARKVITLDAESMNDYIVCKELLRKLWRKGVIWQYVISVIEERKER